MTAKKDKTHYFERQAFNYSVLADVSRTLNNFMLLQDFFNFALELLTEYLGRIQGILLVYSPDTKELIAKASRLYKVSNTHVLVPAFDEKAGMFSLKIEKADLLVREFQQPKLLTPGELADLQEFVPSLSSVIELYGMKEAIALVHRGELKGLVLLGKATKQGSRDKDDPEDLEEHALLNPLADLISTSIENIMLREPAVLESLTGAFTNRYFLSLLERHMESGKTRGEDSALMMVDIDSFKGINDTFGHLVGDSVIRRTASILMENTRDKLDFVGRYGGDEFMVFFPGTDLVTAYAVANRIRVLIAQEQFKSVGSVSVSIGISKRSLEVNTAGELLESADKALYQAKAAGGNSVCLAEGDLQEIGVDVSQTAYQRHIKDRVTAFYSGPYFLSRVDGEMKRSRRYGHPLSIAAIGLSRSSRIRNLLTKQDVEGIFRILANVVLQILRKGIDLPGRFASEYILFLLPETDQVASKKFIRRIQEQLEKLSFPPSEKPFLVSFNAGIACLRDDHRESPQFLGDAIEALEESQHLGEGQILIFNPPDAS